MGEFKDADRNGNPNVTAILNIIDDKRSRYEVAKGVAEWHQLSINKAVGEARINELEIMPSSTFNHPYREYIKQRLAALKEAK